MADLARRQLSAVCNSPVLQKSAVAISGQALLSGFSFALNIILVRSLAPAEYGIFALAIVVGTVGIGLNSALASAPLSVYTPGLARAAPRLTLETAFSAVSMLLTLAIALVTFACAALLIENLSVVCAFSAFAAAWTQRFYIRSIAFARRRPGVAFVGDLVFVLLSVFGLIIGWGGWLTMSSALLVPLIALSAANIGAGLIGLRLLDISMLPTFRRSLLRRYLGFWPKIRWSLAGVTATSLQEHAHGLIVTALAGPAAFAPLAAGQIIFGPVRVALQAAQMVMRPEQAVAIAAHDKAAVRRNLFLTTGVLALGTLVVAVSVTFAWDMVHGFLFAENYADQPMALIVGFWGLITLLLATFTGASSLLQAFKDFRILAMANIFGSLLSVVLVTLFLFVWQPAMSLLGTTIAALFAVVFCVTTCLRRIERTW